MESYDVIKALAAMANASRLQVYRALVVAGPVGRLPGELANEFRVPANTLSFHLKELLTAGLVRCERNGRNLIYRADFERMNALLEYLTANCCQGETCAVEAPESCNC